MPRTTPPLSALGGRFYCTLDGVGQLGADRAARTRRSPSSQKYEPLIVVTSLKSYATSRTIRLTQQNAAGMRAFVNQVQVLENHEQ